jgi:hypothetical protein
VVTDDRQVFWIRTQWPPQLENLSNVADLHLGLITNRKVVMELGVKHRCKVYVLDVQGSITSVER